MLAAIDANAGFQLMQIQGEPSDIDLARCLANKMMTIVVQVWKFEVDGEEKTGNWVSAVAPRSKGEAQAPAQAVPGAYEDDIPF